MRKLVVTADDFGLAPEVNAAVETAHSDGILSAASLMVGGAAVADALQRARRLPGLAVGLHLVLVEGRPVSPPGEIPDLVGTDGRFRDDMVRMSFEMGASARVRRQVEAEIAAQFDAFRQTGLRLDHVNAHKHFHLHPLISRLVLAIGRDFGMRALRVPVELKGVLERVEPGAGKGGRIEALMGRRLRRQASEAGLIVPDAVFGLAWSGAMTPARLEGLLRHCPDGRVEIYTHPATADRFDGAAPGYRYREELAALCDPACAQALAAMGAAPGGFLDRGADPVAAAR
ncbi:hopanoid biosynthesis-associated protein HpnK [Jiella sp. M17.18]|uniref:hopanoid biosynthesis-associated protein HpnK n=1 Tax=Jiella sp. M17.18 TaxID=3234247 RepID=UPI0034DEA36E